MTFEEKYLKYKNKYLSLKYFQNGGDMNYDLYQMIKNSKNREETIKTEINKLKKKIDKYEENNELKTTKEGFLTFDYFAVLSQFKLLNDMLKSKKKMISIKKVPIIGELWGKLYIMYLQKKYNNDKKKIEQIMKEAIDEMP